MLETSQNLPLLHERLRTVANGCGRLRTETQRRANTPSTPRPPEWNGTLATHSGKIRVPVVVGLQLAPLVLRPPKATVFEAIDPNFAWNAWSKLSKIGSLLGLPHWILVGFWIWPYSWDCHIRLKALHIANHCQLGIAMRCYNHPYLSIFSLHVTHSYPSTNHHLWLIYPYICVGEEKNLPLIPSQYAYGSRPFF